MDPNFQLTITRIARAVVYFIYFVVVAILILLVLGFFLRLAGASADAAFVEWVYRNVERAMEPFRGMFPEQDIGDGTSVLDVSLLFGIAFYAIVAILLHALVEWITRQVLTQRQKVDAMYQEQTIDEREAELRRREQALAERERQADFASQPQDQGVPPSPGSPGGGTAP